jgi:BarA-like signal transduction histidine kinase
MRFDVALRDVILKYLNHTPNSSSYGTSIHTKPMSRYDHLVLVIDDDFGTCFVFISDIREK